MAIRFFDENGKEIEKYKIPDASKKPVYEIESEKPIPIYEPIQDNQDGKLTDMTKEANKN